MNHPVVLRALLLLALAAAPAGAATVMKVVDTFDDAVWPAASASAAPGKTSVSTDVAPGVPSRGSLLFEVQFSGKGFQWSAVDAPPGLFIPGDLKTITARGRKSDSRYAFYLKLADGWGRTQMGSRKLECPIPTDPEGTWKTATFTVPRDWVRPVRVVGLGVHNWSARDAKTTVRFWLDHLEVETDVSGVNPATGVLESWKPNPDEQDPKKRQPPHTPLLTFDLATDQKANLFSRTKPAARVSIRNWRGDPLEGRLVHRILDRDGKELLKKDAAVTVGSVARLHLPLPVERFGLYTLEARLALAEGGERTAKLGFARIPPFRDLTEAEKTASPYGLNVHGGSERLLIAPFRKAGIIWFRDYAFQFPTLLRAKGSDRRYAGWPWYPRLVQLYADAGVKLLPCSQKAIERPKVQDGKVVGRIGPDRAWIREIADFINAFPQLTHWELGNEYDLGKENAEAEELIDWKNYRAYHRKFAEILALIGDGQVTAVEQGRAGIWPERERRCVESGDFAKIGVVNSHHYCGVEPPEVNFGNFNTGFETGHRAQGPMLFFDRLREVKRAGAADGTPRESWLTELGWDTLAGKVVSPEQQAAYLARGWMLAMAAGTDKVFWFYDYDSPTPKQFFDGCGLVTAKGEPKLALCALAGLTARLPSPRTVGSIQAGADTAGYVFEDHGSLVAALWTIEGNEGPTVSFRARELYDALGNRLPGTKARLGMAPVYAVGLERTDPLYAQTAYSLHTPYLVAAAAGDPVRPVLRVTNNREQAITCRVRMALPEGWSADAPEATATVAKGQTKDLAMPFLVAAGEPLGRKDVTFTVSEGAEVTRLTLKVLVQTPLLLRVGALRGRPGEATVPVKVRNTSRKPIDATLRMRLPAAWQALTPEIPVAALKPGEIRTLECRLKWNTAWKVGETASIVLDAGKDRRVARSLIPSQLRLHRAKALKMDGRIDEWPEATRVPDWMLGSTLDAPKARVHLAWAPEGIYAAVAVSDTKALASDPRSFWAGDCLELFIDTRDDKRHRFFEPGDHQFWFVPLAGEARAYAGQWKRKDEIPATRYDVQGIQSAARRTPDGYVMELLLPAAQLKGYQPKAGARLGLNVNLTVKGRRLDREVYWPAAKDWAVMNLPKVWGSAELVE